MLLEEKRGGVRDRETYSHEILNWVLHRDSDSGLAEGWKLCISI